MVFVKATAESEKGFKPSPEMTKMMEEMGRFNDELVKAGILKDGECDGLSPSSAGKRVAFDGSSRIVKSGPFKGDLVAGYWIWTVKDLDEAIAWVKRCPNPMAGPSEIEIPADRTRWLTCSRAGNNELRVARARGWGSYPCLTSWRQRQFSSHSS